MSKITRPSEHTARYNLVTDKRRKQHGDSQEDNESIAEILYNSMDKVKIGLKALEFIFAIFAFALAAASPHTFVISCSNKSSTFVQYGYPYRMQRECIDICKPYCLLAPEDKSSPAAQFYVFVGCICFLITPVILGAYFFKRDLFQKYKALVLANFVLAVIISLLWLGSSIAWSVAVSHIRDATSTKNIVKLLNKFVPTMKGCKIIGRRHETIAVSAFFGYLNFVIWIVDAWALFGDINIRTRTQTSTLHETQPGI